MVYSVIRLQLKALFLGCFQFSLANMELNHSFDLSRCKSNLYWTARPASNEYIYL